MYTAAPSACQGDFIAAAILRKRRRGVEALDAEDLAPRLLAAVQGDARTGDGEHVGEQLARRGVGFAFDGGGADAQLQGSLA